jgi:hypothetical protein
MTAVLENESHDMTPARAKVPKEPMDWKQQGLTWLFQQGPTVVVLVIILGFLGWAFVVLVPEHLKAIQQGYDRNSQSFTEAVMKIEAGHDKDRELFRELLDVKRNTP